MEFECTIQREYFQANGRCVSVVVIQFQTDQLSLDIRRTRILLVVR